MHIAAEIYFALAGVIALAVALPALFRVIDELLFD